MADRLVSRSALDRIFAADVDALPLRLRTTAKGSGGSATPRTHKLERATTLTQRGFRGYVNVRGDRSDLRFQQAVMRGMGLVPPDRPNTAVEHNGRAALWLGPDEWLIVAPAGEEAIVVARLRDELRVGQGAVTDVSGGYECLAISGLDARSVLAKGCLLDLHPRVFGPGQCSQTLIAKAGVVIWHRNVVDEFELLVRRSYANYLAEWLVDAGSEFGVVVTPRRSVAR